VTRVIAFVNQKGGVGKTSCCLHLAGALADMGHSVLLVDNDPQASLTQALLGPLATRNLDPEKTALALYGADPTSSLCGYSVLDGDDNRPPFLLIPGCAELYRPNAAADLLGPSVEPEAIVAALKPFVGTLRSSHAEFVLIDNPPNLLGCSTAALAAAHGVVVPISADDFGVQGIGVVNEAIRIMASTINTRVELLGYLATRYRPRLKLARRFLADLRETYPGDVFDATIPDLSGYAEALNAREPITTHAPKSPAAAAVRAATLELLVRLEQSQTDHA